METSLFLAKAFGIYLVVISLALIWHKDMFLAAMEDMTSKPGVTLLSSIFTLILGIILVLFHNVWIESWQLAITLLCWWVLIKGAVRILYPAIDKKLIGVFASNKSLYVSGTLALLLGLWLLYVGFMSQ